MRPLAYFLGAVLGATVAFAGGIPFLTGAPTQETMNQWIQALNGLPSATNNNTPVIVSSGAFCAVSGVSPQTCNAQRGLVTTGTLTTAAATNANYTINNSLLTTNSLCEASVVSYSGTLVTNGYPAILVASAGAGTLIVSITNIHPANALNGTVGIGFMCFQ